MSELMGWDGAERRGPGPGPGLGSGHGAHDGDSILTWLTRLDSEITQVRAAQEANYLFFKRWGAIVTVCFGLSITYFVWVTRNTLISERELPRIEAKVDAHTGTGGHNGTNEQLAAIAVELRYLREDVSRLKAAVDDTRDRGR